ncbi:rRNA methyltransferase [Cryomorphaceae bacterium]|nr:rRNA methyltransferase [Cryomorphaceae bacterium]
MNTPLPEEFVLRLRRDAPLRATNLLKSLDEDPTLSIRWNSWKRPAPDLEPVAWSSHGYYLDHRPVFAADPWWHAGVYYVQEPSSMLLEQALLHLGAILPESAHALDLSAAPGGKTLLLDQCLPDSHYITANEIIPKRASILKENVLRWGSPRIAVTNNAPEHFTPHEETFDLVVVDAPCSGEGMFRKDETARKEWTPESGQQCSTRQSQILDDVWPALKPGGFLLYSTCTFDPAENLDAWSHLNARVLEVPLNRDWGIERIGNAERFGYQCYTDQVRGEGFFFTLLQKPGTLVSSDVRSSTGAPEVPWALKATQTPREVLLNGIRYISKGPQLSEEKGGELRPTTEAVWSRACRVDLPHIELDRDQALSYLHGGDLRIEATDPGMVVLAYRDVPLGMGKQVRGRINNGYPKGYRLRKHPSSLEAGALPW